MKPQKVSFLALSMAFLVLTGTALEAVPPKEANPEAVAAPPPAPANDRPLPMDLDAKPKPKPESLRLRAAWSEVLQDHLYINLEGRGFGDRQEDLEICFKDNLDGDEGPAEPIQEFSLLDLGKDGQVLFFKMRPHPEGEVTFHLTVQGRKSASIPFTFKHSTLPPPPRRLTGEEKAQYARYALHCRQPGFAGRKHGLPYRLIGAQWGISASVAQRLVQDQAERVLYRNVYSEEQRAEGVAAYYELCGEFSYEQIAAGLDPPVSASTLKHWVMRAENPLPLESQREYRSVEAKSALRTEALTDLEDGQGVCATAKRLGVPMSSLQTFLAYPD